MRSMLKVIKLGFFLPLRLWAMSATALSTLNTSLTLQFVKKPHKFIVDLLKWPPVGPMDSLHWKLIHITWCKIHYLKSYACVRWFIYFFQTSIWIYHMWNMIKEKGGKKKELMVRKRQSHSWIGELSSWAKLIVKGHLHSLHSIK